MRRFRNSKMFSVKDYYKCEVCNYKVYSKTGLRLHAMKAHSLDISSLECFHKRTCKSCGKSMSIHSKKRGNCP